MLAARRALSSFSVVASLALASWAGVLHAQESGSEVPPTAGHNLYSLALDGVGDPEQGNYFNRIKNFYEAALRHGQLQQDDYNRFGMLSPNGDEYAEGDLIDFAKDYQCSMEPSAPAEIIYHHWKANPRRFFWFGDGYHNTTKLTHLEPVRFERTADPLVNRIVLQGYTYLHRDDGKYSDPNAWHKDNDGFHGQALRDAPGFHAELEHWRTRDPSNVNHISYDPDYIPGRLRKGSQETFIEIRSEANEAVCEWNEERQRYEYQFNSDPYQETPDGEDDYRTPAPEAWADPADPDGDGDIDYKWLYDWEGRDHNGDNIPNALDPTYDPDGDDDNDGTPNKFDKDYDSSPTPDQTWRYKDHDGDGILNPHDPDYDRFGDDNGDGIRNELDPTYDSSEPTYPDSNPDAFVPRIPEGGEICAVVVSGEHAGTCIDTGEEADSWHEIVQRFSLLFAMFVDFSKLPAAGTCPSFDLPVSKMPFLSSDIEVDLDCELLDYIGIVFVLMASWVGFRIIMD